MALRAIPIPTRLRAAGVLPGGVFQVADLVEVLIPTTPIRGSRTFSLGSLRLRLSIPTATMSPTTIIRDDHTGDGTTSSTTYVVSTLDGGNQIVGNNCGSRDPGFGR